MSHWVFLNLLWRRKSFDLFLKLLLLILKSSRNNAESFPHLEDVIYDLSFKILWVWTKVSRTHNPRNDVHNICKQTAVITLLNLTPVLKCLLIDLMTKINI